ncbi:MAG TPA: acyltransferase [Solirubrobacterales bacterium]|nr:acyltransferase [Solirubrobacterales bacterium]
MESGSEGVRAAAVPDVVAPPPLHPRFPIADGARGFAVISVTVVHVWLFTGGFGGFTESLPNRAMVRMDGVVSIFFLLSAFLLYRPMIAHRGGGPGAPTVGDYARRRFLRIYPAYWVALTGLALFPGLVGVFSDEWWRFYSLGFFLDPGATTACIGDPGFRCGLPQSWTLTVEMTFYLMLPLYAWLTSRLARGRSVRSWMRAELLLIAALSILSLLLGGEPFGLRHDSWYRFSFLSHFFWLGLGLAAAVISVGYGNRREALPRPLRLAAENPAACWALAFAIWVGTVFAYYPAPFPVAPFSSFEYASLNLVQGVMSALLLIPVVFGNPNLGVASRFFGHPLMLWFGLVSYGLYLWSVTITVDLGVGGADAGFWPVLAMTFLITLPFAAASYYLIERPLMRLKYRSLREVLRRPGRAARAQR